MTGDVAADQRCAGFVEGVNEGDGFAGRDVDRVGFVAHLLHFVPGIVRHLRFVLGLDLRRYGPDGGVWAFANKLRAVLGRIPDQRETMARLKSLPEMNPWSPNDLCETAPSACKPLFGFGAK